MINYEGLRSAAALLDMSPQALHRRIKTGSFPTADVGLGDFHIESPISSLHALSEWMKRLQPVSNQMSPDLFLGWNREKVINFGLMAGLLQADETPNPARITGGHVTKENFLTFPQEPLRAVYLSVKAIQRLTPMSWTVAKARLGEPDVLIGNHYGGWHPQRVVDVLTQATA